MYLDVQLIINRLAEEVGPYTYDGHTYRIDDNDDGFVIVDANDGGVTPIELAARVACDWLLSIEPDYRRYYGLPVYMIDGNDYVVVVDHDDLIKAAAKVVADQIVSKMRENYGIVAAMARFLKDDKNFIAKYIETEGVDNILPDLGDEFHVKGVPDYLLRMI
jgi:hypothetical protein